MANQAVYGFETLQDRLSQRIGDNLIDEVNTAITTAVEFHNQQLNAIMDLFVAPTTKAKTRYRHPFTTRNQPLDQFGRPRPVKGAQSYDVAFPLQMSGSRMGWTWQNSANVTVADVQETIYSIMMGDQRWVFDHILAALFQDDGWTYLDDDDDIGSLTIEGLANGDSFIYSMYSGSDVGATDDHILAQANAIGSGSDNPYPTILAELEEHPENGSGPFIAFIPTALKATTTALGTFNPVRDPNITPATSSDTLTGSLGVTVPGGDRMILGYEDSGIWIVEYPRLPSEHIIAVSAGGAPPLGMRQPEPAEQQGFAEVPADMDSSPFPFMQRSWIRQAGFGGWNRVGGVAYRIGNGTYAVPTGYSAPMP